jgi:acyl-coenzyme A synthetase/AMP-(fatty) acid ligase
MAPLVGVPDPDLGQRVAGFVQLVDGAQSVDLNEILAFASERLADYKVPEALEIVDKIPRNTLGKIDRQLLSVDDLKGGREDRVGELVGGCFPLSAPLQGGTGNCPTHHRGL